MMNRAFEHGKRSQFSFAHTASALVAMILAVVGFANTLQSSFTNWDDPALVLENPTVRGISPRQIAAIFASLTEHAYLPLRTLSYALDYAVWGLNPFGFHLTNLVLHAVNSGLVFGLLYLMFRRTGLALVASALFAVHPVHTEAVAWVSGRKDLLTTFFAMLALVFFVARTTGKKVHILCAASAACACLSKPTAVVLPVLLWASDAYRRNGERDRVSRLCRFYAILPTLVVCFALAIVHFWVGWSEGVIKRGACESSGIGRYLTALIWPNMEAARLLFFPVALCPVYVLGKSGVLPSIPLLGVGCTLSLIIGAVLSWRKRDAVLAFAIIWIIIAYLPTSNILPTGLPLAERYLYFPSVGLCLGMSAVLVHLFRQGRVGGIAAGGAALALVLVFLLGTWSQNLRWRDSLSLWRSAAQVLPTSSEVWNDLASAYSQFGYLPRARAAFLLSARLESPTPRTHLNRGLLCMKEGNPAGAVADLARAAADAQYAAEAYFHLGQAYESLGRLAEALRAYSRAAELNPRAAAARNNIGVIHERRGNLAAAREAYEAAIAADRGYSLAYYNLGNLEQKQKNLSAAETAYRSAIALNGDHAMSRCNLASVLLERGEIAEAKEEFEKAAALDPSLWQPLLGLGFIAAAQNKKDSAIAYARRVLLLDPSNSAAQVLIERLGK